jgi:GT2 family glycosyltransferase
MALTSIVILMGNRHDMTRRCVESIFRHTYEAFELVMVDNGSTDGTLDYLENVTQSRIIKNSENRGFAAGNNQGMAVAQGDYILLLNNDIIVTPH